MKPLPEKHRAVWFNVYDWQRMGHWMPKGSHQTRAAAERAAYVRCHNGNFKLLYRLRVRFKRLEQ